MVSVNSNRETSLPQSLAFSDVFHPDCVETIRRGTGMSSVISLLVSILKQKERISREQSETIIRDLLAKEQRGSSALGQGLAFPHLRTRHVSRFVGAIGVAPEGVQFGAADGQPVKLIFLTLAPWDRREQHSELMSRLVSLTADKSVVLRLQRPLTARTVYRWLVERDVAIHGTPKEST